MSRLKYIFNRKQLNLFSLGFQLFNDKPHLIRTTDNSKTIWKNGLRVNENRLWLALSTRGSKLFDVDLYQLDLL